MQMRMKMTPSKCILLLVFALFAVVTLQPSAAVRDAQVFKPTVAVGANAGMSQPAASLPGLPGLPPLVIPKIPPLQPLPPLVIPKIPPLQPLPPLVIPPIPQLQPLPTIVIPQLPPLPSLPSIVIPPIPPLPPLPRIVIPPVQPLLPLLSIVIPPLPPVPTTPRSPSAPAQVLSSQSALEAQATPQPTECLPSLMELMPCIEYLTKTDVSVPLSICCDGFKLLVEKAPICLCQGINGNINKMMPTPIDFTRMMSLLATCSVAPSIEALTKCFTGPVPPLMPAPTPAAAPSPGPSA